MQGGGGGSGGRHEAVASTASIIQGPPQRGAVAENRARAATAVLSSAERLARYRIVRKLGEGGFGSAHLVEAKETGKEYVLKMIKCRTKDEKLEALKEMVAMRVVRDNFIVEFHEFWQSEGENEVYLVMEYCEDGDLFKRLRAAWENQQRLREDRILRWFAQICMGLQAIHRAQLIHRDIKPGNVFLGRWDVVKLGDFGLVTIGAANPAAKVDGGVAGTPGFMAPEVRNGQPYNSKADVWAAGCTLYEMLTLRSAYVDDKNGKFPQPVPEFYRKDMERLMFFLLEPDPDKRPSVEQVLQHPLVRPVAEQIRREQKLLEQVKELEKEIGYDHRGLIRQASAEAAAAAAAAAPPALENAAAKLSGPAAVATAVIEWMTRNVPRMPEIERWLVATYRDAKRAGRWVHSALYQPDHFGSVSERRVGGSSEGVDALRVFNLVMWAPLLLAMLGALSGMLLAVLEQMTLVLMLAVACPVITTSLMQRIRQSVSHETGTVPWTHQMALRAGSVVGGFFVTIAVLPGSLRLSVLSVFGLFVIIAACVSYYVARVAEAAGALDSSLSPSNVLYVAAGVTLGVSASTSWEVEGIAAAGMQVLRAVAVICATCVALSHASGAVERALLAAAPKHRDDRILRSFASFTAVPGGVVLIGVPLLYPVFRSASGSFVLFFLPPVWFFGVLFVLHVLLETMAPPNSNAPHQTTSLLPLPPTFRVKTLPAAAVAAFASIAIWTFLVGYHSVL